MSDQEDFFPILDLPKNVSRSIFEDMRLGFFFRTPNQDAHRASIVTGFDDEASVHSSVFTQNPLMRTSPSLCLAVLSLIGLVGAYA